MSLRGILWHPQLLRAGARTTVNGSERLDLPVYVHVHDYASALTHSLYQYFTSVQNHNHNPWFVHLHSHAR